MPMVLTPQPGFEPGFTESEALPLSHCALKLEQGYQHGHFRLLSAAESMNIPSITSSLDNNSTAINPVGVSNKNEHLLT